MKKLAITLLVLASSTAYAQSTTQATLEKSLKIWHPASISQVDGKVTITLNENQVTNEIYKSVITMGVCPPLYSASKKSSYLEGVKEINILNIHGAAGFTFEAPKNSCNEIGEATGNNGDVVLLSHTHAY